MKTNLYPEQYRIKNYMW